MKLLEINKNRQKRMNIKYFLLIPTMANDNFWKEIKGIWKK